MFYPGNFEWHFFSTLGWQDFFLRTLHTTFSVFVCCAGRSTQFGEAEIRSLTHRFRLVSQPPNVKFAQRWGNEKHDKNVVLFLIVFTAARCQRQWKACLCLVLILLVLYCVFRRTHWFMIFVFYMSNSKLLNVWGLLFFLGLTDVFHNCTWETRLAGSSHFKRCFGICSLKVQIIEIPIIQWTVPKREMSECFGLGNLGIRMTRME